MPAYDFDGRSVDRLIILNAVHTSHMSRVSTISLDPEALVNLASTEQSNSLCTTVAVSKPTTSSTWLYSDDRILYQRFDACDPCLPEHLRSLM